ncbi:MAG: permease [Caldilineaceae bacterium]|nr:permease [Caldilineaceae bacterium]MBP8123980.1 permease [Caldilineaceae bacterium]MBP9074025.1 permease [Caldilineaceae bacterium]
MADGFVFAEPELMGVQPDSLPEKQPVDHQRERRAWALVLTAAVVWWVAWRWLQPVTEWLTFNLIGLDPLSHLGESVAFFLYDVPKILLLLTGMIFLVTTVRTFFSVERTRALLGGRREGVGNTLAALLGVVTPFCSCSAVPLFIGFVESGIPLGVTFSFLISAPMVNEIALAMLFGLFGWKIAGLYLVTGLTVAIVAGMIIGRIPNVEQGVEEFVWQLSVGKGAEAGAPQAWSQRFATAWESTRSIVGKVWIYVIVGIAVGAGIHGYVPEDALATILGKGAWWSVPAGVILGIPLYANAAGIIPVVHALMEKGAALGTVLAFMMSVVALSLPEMVILRRVLKPRLIGIFVGVVAIGIILTGYLFNLVI